jgi:hypothetical protein
MRRFVHTIFTFLVAVLLGSGWYVYHKGFTRKWRSFVSEEFRKRGIELTLRKLTLDPLRGVIAQEVKVFDARDRKRTLAVIDDMRLVINWANLIRGKTFLDALDLRDAKIITSARSEGPPRTENRYHATKRSTDASARASLPQQPRGGTLWHSSHFLRSGLINPQQVTTAPSPMAINRRGTRPRRQSRGSSMNCAP